MRCVPAPGSEQPSRMGSSNARPPALGSGSLRCWIMHEVDRNSYKGRENEAETSDERLGFCWSWVGILQLPPLPIFFKRLLSCFRFLTISGRSVQALRYSVVNNGPPQKPFCWTCLLLYTDISITPLQLGPTYTIHTSYPISRALPARSLVTSSCTYDC